MTQESSYELLSHKKGEPPLVSMVLQNNSTLTLTISG